jgi:hypothetical protein
LDLSAALHCQLYYHATVWVCRNAFEIPLDVSSVDSNLPYLPVHTDAYRQLPVDPYMLDPDKKFHMGSDAIHLNFWTHTAVVEYPNPTHPGWFEYPIDQLHQRHWALWMDTSGYLEVRYMLESKSAHFGATPRRWFVAGSLEKC